MEKKLAILLLMNIIFIFVVQADINGISTDSVRLDDIRTTYDINTLKKLDIDSIEIKFYGSPMGEIKIFPEYYTTSVDFVSMCPSKYEISSAEIDSLICPIDSLYIKRCVPKIIGYKDIGLRKGDAIYADGLFIDYQIYMHDGRILKDLEYFPYYKDIKKVIYSENVKKLITFIERKFEVIFRQKEREKFIREREERKRAILERQKQKELDEAEK